MWVDEVVENAWVRSGGRCECSRRHHGHGVECGRALAWAHRGTHTATGWELVRHGDPKVGGWQAVKDAQVLCVECYRRVTTEHTGAGPCVNPPAPHPWPADAYPVQGE
jgi:hypothetical protein